VHFVIAVVNHVGRVVSHKNVYAGKAFKCFADLRLFEEMVSLWFVFPGSAKAAENYTPDLMLPEVEVNNGFRKRSIAVMISFDCQDMMATCAKRRFQDDRFG